jgi:aspartate/methionine/tyrosine aminotransferase
MGLVDEGDEVIFFDPSYDCYRAQVQMAGGKSIGIPLKPKFQVNYLNKIEQQRISEKSMQERIFGWT